MAVRNLQRRENKMDSYSPPDNLLTFDVTKDSCSAMAVICNVKLVPYEQARNATFKRAMGDLSTRVRDASVGFANSNKCSKTLSGSYVGPEKFSTSTRLIKSV